MHLFVYYKFNPADYPTIVMDARQLTAAVQDLVPGVRAQLLMRPTANSAGEHTWMEAYEVDAAKIERLQQVLSELLAKSSLPGGRHVELFVDVVDR